MTKMDITVSDITDTFTDGNGIIFYLMKPFTKEMSFEVGYDTDAHEWYIFDPYEEPYNMYHITGNVMKCMVGSSQYEEMCGKILKFLEESP